MNDRRYLYFGLLILVLGCSDENEDPVTDPCSLCQIDQVCIEKVCHSKTECVPACTEQEVCVDGTCEKKQVEPEDICEPACSGQYDTCIKGGCAFCIGNQCFYEGKKKDGCEKDEECGGNQVCKGGTCVDREPDGPKDCVPACMNGQICDNGKCLNQTALWTLCRTGSDCGNGECIFDVTPSRVMQLKAGDSIHTFDSANHIPLSFLDSRINVENYNLTHSNPANDEDTIGICSYDCTEKASNCPSGWTCQLVAKAETVYPGIENLPSAVSDFDMNSVGYAALCRRNMSAQLSESLPFSPELCKSDESACEIAGDIFYNQMCLPSCESENALCPFMFSCTEVSVDGGNKKVCMPDTGTCSDCYDRDGDGSGYGHCSSAVMDCNDDDAEIYVGKALTCSDIADSENNIILTDKNCNGIIDKFELLGTTSNCNACGNACKVPGSKSIAVACEAVDTENLSASWREEAPFDMSAPEFKCVEKCAFGFGDCSNNARCDTALLTSNAITEAESSEEFELSVLDVVIGNSSASIYAMDADQDGYPRVDVAATQDIEISASSRKIMLDSANTLICCSQNEDLCYSADRDWITTSPKERAEVIDSETGTVNYVKIKLPVNADANEYNNVRYYDSNDEDASINPKAIEICDGIDNDGSTLLAGNGAVSCRTFCSGLGATGTELTIIQDICKTFSEIANGKVVYRANAYCDVTEDGLNDTKAWIDPVDKTEHLFNDTCKMRHEAGNVCNDQAVVQCKKEPVIWCNAGTEDCLCGFDEHGAFRITPDNTHINEETGEVTYSPVAEHYVKQAKWVGNDIDAEFCRCDGSKCENDNGCTDKDSARCFELCHANCRKNISYGLNCIGEADKDSQDGLKLDDSGKLVPVFDGFDSNCDGVPDDAAIVPCVITADAEYLDYMNGVSSSFDIYVTNDNYKHPLNKTDNSLNLCKLGILKRGNLMNPDKTFAPVCIPLFEPRAYDFYGDGIDSNCDGVDYDLSNTILVASESQGDIQGGGGSCRFDEKGYAHPCPTLSDAISKAKVEIANGIFYQDILITASTYEEKPDTNIAIQIPSAEHMKFLPQYYTLYDNETLQNEMYQGHILDGLTLHRNLVNRTKRDSSFNPNHYIYRYDKRTAKSVIEDGMSKTVYNFEPIMSEKTRPEEYIRIFGGFSRTQNSSGLKSEKDFWNRTGETTVNYKPEPSDLNYRNSFSMIALNEGQTGNISLLLDHLTLNMGETDAASVGDDTSLSYTYAEGITYIGINGTTGIDRLNLQNTEVNVSAPVGYGFSDASQSGNKGATGKDAQRDTYNWNDYVTSYSGNLCQQTSTSLSNYCGYGNEGNQYISYAEGGCGGYADGHTGKGASHAKGKNSKALVLYNYLQRFGSYNLAYNGVLSNAVSAGALGSLGSGGCDESVGQNDDEKRGDYNGAAGKGGNGGKNGLSKDIVMSWKLDNAERSIYVHSNRSKGKGHYGIPGFGGGGGSIKRCWYHSTSSNTDCFAGSGGNGGCGGEGGEAGGTGGSALGIVLMSDSKIPGSTKLIMNESNISVTPGSGGLQQRGGDGGIGGDGGRAYRYAREGVANVDTQCQRMGSGGPGGGGGAGGAGAGGRRGWAYPFVFACAQSLNLSYDDDSTLASLANCGFSIPENMKNNPSDFGTQNLSSAISYADSQTLGGNGSDGDSQTKSTRAKSQRDDARPGGAGGVAASLTGDEDINDHSCMKLNADGKGYHNIIVKTITIEN